MEQQTATSEVLSVISSSPGDLQPVFDRMLANATRLCEANFGLLVLYRGDGRFRVVAMHNAPPAFAKLRQREPEFYASPKTGLGRAAATKEVVHIADYADEEAYKRRDPAAVALGELGGARTFLVVPMLKDNEMVGAIAIYRQQVRPFSDKQIALVANFAAQAVIAIENTRLLNELRQRTTDLTESLEQQTATSEVLQVISRSPGDLEPVFQTILASAVRICDAKFGILFRYDNEAFDPVAQFGIPSALAEFLRQRRGSFQPVPGSLLDRVMRTKQVCHTADYAAEAALGMAVKLGGARSTVDVPMLKDNVLIGAISIYRQEVRPFTDKQIELVQNFAAQAVIAIENARLLSELRESLAQQTATADVLGVISRSPGDLEPVFAAMLENATRLCEAPFGTMFLRDDGVLRLVARHIPSGRTATFEPGSELVIADNSTHPLVRLLDSKEVIHFADLRRDPSYIGGNPRVVAFVDLIGARTGVCVPMLKDDECVGAFVAIRLEVRPFADKQIELVKNFAAQAVIAIENARLLNELRQRTDDLTESLERQTATADLLGTISRSKFELQPILQSVVDAAARLCRAEAAGIFRLEGDVYRFAAGYSLHPDYLERERQSSIAAGPGTVVGRAAMMKEVVRIDDALTDPLYEQKDDARIGGYRSMIGVPLMREGEPIGAIGLARCRVEPFSDREIELVKTFADQAVIAIENVRLFEAEQQRTRELTETLEQQTATSEVLSVISSSPGELQPVFHAMLQNAARVCDAKFGMLFRLDDGAVRPVASVGVPAPLMEYFESGPRLPSEDAPIMRAAATKRPVHVVDFANERPYQTRNPLAVAAIERFGVRTLLVVPLLKEGEFIGAFAIFRQEVRPFTEKQIELLQNFASQAVIAIENTRLLTELRQRTADLTESLEQQTATSEVLQVISTSPGNLEPVFASMLENAVRICQAKFGIIYRWDGEALHMLSAHNAPPAFAEARRRLPQRPSRENQLMGRMLETKAAVQVADAAATPGYVNRSDTGAVAAVELGSARTVLAVPMLKESELIGSFTVYRQEVRPFTDKQVALVTGFAAQAVIAIENARLLTELRQRTADLTESLEQQTATSEVLRVISSSPGELEPVFQAMLTNAVRMCGAKFGMLYRYDSRSFSLAAHIGAGRRLLDLMHGPINPHPDTILGRVLATNSIVEIEDATKDQAYPNRNPVFIAGVEEDGTRGLLGVPMLQENTLVGTFVVFRQEAGPFTEKQIKLVQNFAAQAVIAIENARLLSELRESLERQTATAEVLSVISRSPGDLSPVFESILQNATRICDANFANLELNENGIFRVGATYNAPAAFAEQRQRAPMIRPHPKGVIAHIVATKQAFQCADLLEHPSYKEGAPGFVDLVEKARARTLLGVPLLKEDEVVGVFGIYRQEVRPFGEKQIELVKNFAAQAVIAIENTRLLNELRQRTDDLTESLEQQTATSEVLQVISASPGDLKPVFDSVLANATGICGANFGMLNLYEGGAFPVVATHNTPPAYVELRRRQPMVRPDQNHPLGRVAATKQVLHIADITTEAGYRERDASYVAFADLAGGRTLLVVPMLKENELVGTISIFRQEVRSFTDKQIELVKNFAAQAVIAIENARLLTELRQRTDDLTESLEQQTATSEVLQVISSSPGDLQPVFDAMLEHATRICQAQFGTLNMYDGSTFRSVALHNPPPQFAMRRGEVIRPHPESGLGYVARTKQIAHIDDIRTRQPYLEGDEAVVRLADLAGARTLLVVPMLKENKLIGTISIYRQEVRRFIDKQIELVRNFAAQAVIAIENTRLLTELRERTTDLTESLEQQTATSEVLQVISSSPGETERVFETMLAEAVRICAANFGHIYRRENEGMHLVARYNTPPAFTEFRRRSPQTRLIPETFLGRMAAAKAVLHVADIAADRGYIERVPEIVAAVELGGVRTFLAVPMLKEDELIGAFTLFRQEIRPFTDKQIALVENFASQAVIAIENARLLGELRQRTDELGRSVGELRALGEVSQAVNSTLDLETVLSTIVAKAVQLSGTEAGAIYVFDEGLRELRLRATHGMDQELIDALGQQHIRLDEANLLPGAARGQPVQVADMREEPQTELGDIILRAGYRARLIAPLIRGEAIVGILVVRRKTPGAFPQNTVDLMKTFAAQSALAIQNARLFHEIEDKGHEIEVASRHKSQFLANMSHELRTPLNAILGYTELIIDSIYGDPPEKMREVLERVQTNGRHLLGLINDVLDLSKIEAGQLTLSLTDYSLANLVQGVFAAVEPLAAQKNLALTTKIAPSLPEGHGDERRLSQVLLNLVGNAIKFTDKGEVAIEASLSDGSFRVAVRDSGPGIAAADQVKIFEEFQQVDNTLTKQKGGTGLGLAISKRIVEMHGGGISVDSELGKGSTFTIRLPVHACSEGQAA